MATELIWILFFASFIHAMVGFGYGPIFIGLMSLFLPLNQVILISFLFGPVVTMIMIFLTFNRALVWYACRLLFFGCIGLPMGYFIFLHLNINVLQILFGLFLMGSVVLTVFGRHYISLNIQTAGICSGIFGVLFGSSGPFLSLYLMSKSFERRDYLFVLNLVFFILGVCILAFYVWDDQYTLDHLKWGVQGCLGIFFGTGLGMLIGRAFSTQWHRRLVLVGIFMMGFMLMINA